MKPIFRTDHWGCCRTLLAMLLVGWLWLPGTSCAQNFHLLVFADTDDPGLSAPNLSNVAYLTEMADSVCRRTGMTNRMTVYKGKDFLASRCDQVLADLRPAPNDVVFFYFMGHGWNNSETEEPMLLFKAAGQSPGTANSRNLKAVFEQLRRKGNRLTLAFGESCNSAINDRSRAKKGTGAVMNVSVYNTEQVKNLFLRSRMSILLHTCKRNQKSNSSEDGGWFFTSFLDQFKQFASRSYKQPAQWEPLLVASAQSTTDYAREQGALQEPVFHIFTAESASAASVAPAPPKPTQPGAGKGKPVTDPVAEAAKPAEESPATRSPDTDNVCAINRTAYNTVRSNLLFLRNFSSRVEAMEADDASEEFRKYYSPDRKIFFHELPQKLNVTHLSSADVFTQESNDIAELLDDIAYYLENPQFKMNAKGKLPQITDGLNGIAARVQDLLRRCKE